ncbi:MULTISPECIES: DUF3883 domain-containing protein [unclassified Exiguobacterium]|uniref:DUF3883 domain-containing protein n=1 Tax=unclassified Exiguobacterium TaxID=2644629 RepID=UPI001038B373|nr:MULTISPECIES: DUF3883 domain-containing protein [unclassified Exiguobacterium]TCI42969.1 DUF3883 domain-containing protein [Exiguobacterium sp. SH5S32]TCI49695.1 DUF3883 domain-containing protein [Exiguobacterium sp. SH1S4]TCI67820.1 DUF3883 domain-containing protein [Exiguobacterium sp. SH1S1]
MKRKELSIVSFYLAKYNREAVKNLGFKSFSEAYRDIGKRLGYKPNSVNNRRDDFDPLFNHRVGWHKRELNDTSLQVIDQFDHLSEESLREIVKDIMNNQMDPILEDILSRSASNRTYTTRGVTGKKAEEYFSNWFATHYPNESLIDTRDFGCGYDFGLKDSESVFEVKGIATDSGGIQFTDKEWSVARDKKENYYLVIVKNCLLGNPSIQVHPNPVSIFRAEKRISTVINVSWGIREKDLDI